MDCPQRLGHAVRHHDRHGQRLRNDFAANGNVMHAYQGGVSASALEHEHRQPGRQPNVHGDGPAPLLHREQRQPRLSIDPPWPTRRSPRPCSSASMVGDRGQPDHQLHGHQRRRRRRDDEREQTTGNSMTLNTGTYTFGDSTGASTRCCRVRRAGGPLLWSDPRRQLQLLQRGAQDADLRTGRACSPRRARTARAASAAPA